LHKLRKSKSQFHFLSFQFKFKFNFLGGGVNSIQIPIHEQVEPRTCRDCFPKMVPTVYTKWTVFIKYLKRSVHLQSSQCFVLYLGTHMMLPFFEAILRLVSGIAISFYLLYAPIYWHYMLNSF